MVMRAPSRSSNAYGTRRLLKLLGGWTLLSVDSGLAVSHCSRRSFKLTHQERALDATNIDIDDRLMRQAVAASPPRKKSRARCRSLPCWAQTGSILREG